MSRRQPVTLYYDVGSPYAYLAASRLASVIGSSVVWQPVLLGALFKLTGRSSWARGDLDRRRQGMEEIERRAQRYGLPPLRWPDPWPSDYLHAMRIATYAHAEGRSRDYALAAMRAAFRDGRDLADAEVALAAATEAGLDADAAGAAASGSSVKNRLRAATDAAHARGVFGVPTLAVAGELFWGDDRVEDAAAALARSG